MPTYANRCQSCKHEFDSFQKMSDDPIAVCPRCDGDVVRLIGAGCGIIFKGSGWPGNDMKKGRQ
jgi:putative FmdB family regulatory protein